MLISVSRGSEGGDLAVDLDRRSTAFFLLPTMLCKHQIFLARYALRYVTECVLFDTRELGCSDTDRPTTKDLRQI